MPQIEIRQPFVSVVVEWVGSRVVSVSIAGGYRIDRFRPRVVRQNRESAAHSLLHCKLQGLIVRPRIVGGQLQSADRLVDAALVDIGRVGCRGVQCRVDFGRHLQSCPLRSDVPRAYQQVVRKLPLQNQIPVLHIAGRHVSRR